MRFFGFLQLFKVSLKTNGIVLLRPSKYKYLHVVGYKLASLTQNYTPM